MVFEGTQWKLILFIKILSGNGWENGTLEGVLRFNPKYQSFDGELEGEWSLDFDVEIFHMGYAKRRIRSKLKINLWSHLSGVRTALLAVAL